MTRPALAVLIWLLVAGAGVAALFVSAGRQLGETFGTDARILHRVLSQRMEQQEAVLNAVDELERRGVGPAALGFLLGTVGLNVRPFAHGLELERALDAEGPPAIGCLLLDIRMPHISGLQLQRRLQDRGVDLPVILLTGHADVELCRRAFRQGAADFLSKPVDDTELLEAVQRAVRQHLRLRQHRAAGGQARKRLSRLSAREHEVLRGIVDGQTSKQLARTLEISARTVETHRASVFARLEAESLAEVIRLALEARGARLGNGPAPRT